MPKYNYNIQKISKEIRQYIYNKVGVDYINKSKVLQGSYIINLKFFKVGIFNLNNCNYNIHINMNIHFFYCLILITISKYNN